MKSLIKTLSSVKLAITLLIIITIASVVGTLIPQHRSTAEYIARYGQLANLFTRLELTSLYQSWWFLSLLSLFSLNIVVCTLTRLSPKLRRALKPSLLFEKKSLVVTKIQDRLKKSRNLAHTGNELRKEFASRHYRVKEKEEGNRLYLLARKKTLGLFGSDIVHLGLLIILLGGIVSGLGGFRANINISEGEVLPVPKASFHLRLDEFRTEFYPNGAVRDWKSTLTVIEGEKELMTRTVEVNHPLSYKGYVFYQSSYGWDWKNPTLEIWAKKSSNPSFLQKIKLKIGEEIRLKDENIVITVLHFVPDFVINEKNEIATRSLEPNNPAAFIQGEEGDEVVFSGWIFARFPDFSRIHSSKETDLKFELQGFEGNQYSGIQVSKDPGVNLIWLGCSFLMIGLFIAFFWTPREIRVILEESQGKTEISAGGLASKNKEALASEFAEIIRILRRSK
ncbi:MAG: cytochrome c biogenesis protein ResB [Candidatus Aminicenantales bacterium]